VPLDIVTLPVGVPELPATVIATTRLSVCLIEVLAGVTVTVGVVFVVPPPPPPLPPPPPHPTAKKLAARTTSIVQKRLRDRFDQPGTKNSINEANAAPPAALNHPVRFAEASFTALAGAAVELTVTCPVPLVVLALSVTVD